MVMTKLDTFFKKFYLQPIALKSRVFEYHGFIYPLRFIHPIQFREKHSNIALSAALNTFVYLVNEYYR